jgi:hypothetical protein
MILPRCGNVAAILELDEHLQRDFTIFEASSCGHIWLLVSLFGI